MMKPDAARRGPKPTDDAYPCGCHCHLYPPDTVKHFTACCFNGWKIPSGEHPPLTEFDVKDLDNDREQGPLGS